MGSYILRDITFLESNAPYMALEWAKNCSQNNEVVMASYSTATIDAFAKGRSSKQAMVTHCRRQAVLQLSAGLMVILLQVQTGQSPAEYGTMDPDIDTSHNSFHVYPGRKRSTTSKIMTKARNRRNFIKSNAPYVLKRSKHRSGSRPHAATC